MTIVAHRASEWERLEKRSKAIPTERAELDRAMARLEDQLAAIDAGIITALDRDLISHRLGLVGAERLGLKSELEAVIARMTEIEAIVEERSRPIEPEAGPTVQGEELTTTVQAIKDQAGLEEPRRGRHSA